MDNLVLSSTLFLTVLLFVGLFFFLRASTKDRTEMATWQFAVMPEQILQDVTQYLESRSYRLQSVNPETDEAIFKGVVGASWGLAIFLSLLAGVAAACLGLVISLEIPQVGLWGLVSIVIAPAAGWFYRKKSQRTEQVAVLVRGDSENLQSATQTKLHITAHRDEIESLRVALNYPFPED
jgi:hypothetical protein